MAWDTTQGVAVLKQLYDTQAMQDLTFKDRPFLSMVPKGTWEGTTIEDPLGYAGGAGGGGTISKCITNSATGPSLERFSVTMRKQYFVCLIDNEMIEKTKSDKGAFVRALKFIVDSGMNSLANNLETQLFRGGGGGIGTIATGGYSSTILKLANRSDIVNFEKNMVIQGDTVDGGGTVHAGTEAITDVDRAQGWIYGADFSTITGLADGDTLFRDGDYDKALHGLDAWDPLTAPGATSFFGVDRSSDTVRLGGNRVSAAEVSGKSIEEKLHYALMRVSVEGGTPDVGFLNPEDFHALSVSMEGRKVISDVQVGKFGFKAITIVGPTGECKMVANRKCPKGIARLLQMNTWKLYSTSGGIPKILDLDGMAIRASTDDAYEVRLGFYGNLRCTAPGWNCVVDLSE